VTYNAASLVGYPGFVDSAELTVVPESGTALFGIAWAGVAAFRRRRNSAV
jgi:MYXO-CTERM domain-containing protein